VTASHLSGASYRPGEPDPPTMPLLWRVGVTPVILPPAGVPAGKSMSSQMVAFAIVGGLSTLIDFGGFNALHFWFGLGPVKAKMLAVAASTLFSYYGNRRWSFAVSETSSHRRDLPLFIGLNGIGLLIALAAVAGTRYGLGLTSALALNVFGNLGGALLGTAFRFWAYRTVVFRVSSSNDAPADASGAAPPHPARPASSGPSAPRSRPAVRTPAHHALPAATAPPPVATAASQASPASPNAGRHRRSRTPGRVRP
jgi:putative flippase GtrA